eukprot:m.24913 g.24913  ORF g.24913 m.24913 type:complete len:880 (+) comp8658_c0_seq2:305-2944(+)
MSDEVPLNVPATLEEERVDDKLTASVSSEAVAPEPSLEARNAESESREVIGEDASERDSRMVAEKDAQEGKEDAFEKDSVGIVAEEQRQSLESTEQDSQEGLDRDQSDGATHDEKQQPDQGEDEQLQGAEQSVVFDGIVDKQEDNAAAQVSVEDQTEDGASSPRDESVQDGSNTKQPMAEEQFAKQPSQPNQIDQDQPTSIAAEVSDDKEMLSGTKDSVVKESPTEQPDPSATATEQPATETSAPENQVQAVTQATENEVQASGDGTQPTQSQAQITTEDDVCEVPTQPSAEHMSDDQASRDQSTLEHPSQQGTQELPVADDDQAEVQSSTVDTQVSANTEYSKEDQVTKAQSSAGIRNDSTVKEEAAEELQGSQAHDDQAASKQSVIAQGGGGGIGDKADDAEHMETVTTSQQSDAAQSDGEAQSSVDKVVDVVDKAPDQSETMGLTKVDETLQSTQSPSQEDRTSHVVSPVSISVSEVVDGDAPPVEATHAGGTSASEKAKIEPLETAERPSASSPTNTAQEEVAQDEDTVVIERGGKIVYAKRSDVEAESTADPALFDLSIDVGEDEASSKGDKKEQVVRQDSGETSGMSGIETQHAAEPLKVPRPPRSKSAGVRRQPPMSARRQRATSARPVAGYHHSSEEGARAYEEWLRKKNSALKAEQKQKREQERSLEAKRQAEATRRRNNDEAFEAWLRRHRSKVASAGTGQEDEKLEKEKRRQEQSQAGYERWRRQKAAEARERQRREKEQLDALAQQQEEVERHRDEAHSAVLMWLERKNAEQRALEEERRVRRKQESKKLRQIYASLRSPLSDTRYLPDYIQPQTTQQLSRLTRPQSEPVGLRRTAPARGQVFRASTARSSSRGSGRPHQQFASTFS